MQTGGLACNYFDRYIATVLKRGNANKSLMQMIASTCLLIAAKFFDRKLPPLSELETVHSGSVTAAEFAALETEILEVLQWQLHVPMPHSFIAPLRQLLPDAPFGEVVEDRMQFFIDLSVYGYELLQYSAAEIAAGALLAAWNFSGEYVAVTRYLPQLAHNCCTVDARLSVCAKSLIDYYQVRDAGSGSLCRGRARCRLADRLPPACPLLCVPARHHAHSRPDSTFVPHPCARRCASRTRPRRTTRATYLRPSPPRPCSSASATGPPLPTRSSTSSSHRYPVEGPFLMGGVGQLSWGMPFPGVSMGGPIMIGCRWGHHHRCYHARRLRFTCPFIRQEPGRTRRRDYLATTTFPFR